MELNQSAARYFSFLARNFPVMCASDEFHFMPRADESSRYYEKMENLDRDAVCEHLQEIHRFREKIERYPVSDSDLEASIDKQLLLSNIDGILIELEQKDVLRYNPLIYLKVGFIGLEHAVMRPAEDTGIVRDRTLARMRQIPDLLEQATKNLELVPRSLSSAALSMIEDCIGYVDELEYGLSVDSGSAFDKTLTILCERIVSSLSSFKRFLEATPEGLEESKTGPHADIARRTAQTIEATLQNHFLSTRSLEDVYRIGREERTRCLTELKRLSSEIDPNATWHELYEGYTPAEGDIFSLYRSECDRLTEFFRNRGFNTPARPRIVQTPRYLQSIRGSASFSASLPTDCQSCDYFYITTGTCSPQGDILQPDNKVRKKGRLHSREKPMKHTEKESTIQKRINRRLHREYKFLTAHETVPGHHLLDSCRRTLVNPVRRQIESPLFYEGWACYAESLLIEYGYIDSKIELLVNQKRELWRAARCQIDAGLSAGFLDFDGCIDLLLEAGFKVDEARAQIDRFLLNPGYQLCYTLGRWEILRLKKKFGPVLGLEDFHRVLLDAGEVPFSLMEKWLAAQIKRRNIT